MRAPFFVLFVACTLLACEQQRPTTQPVATSLATDSTAAAARPTALPSLPPDTTDVSRTHLGYQTGHDTTFSIGQQRYRLLLRAESDSTKPLVVVSEGTVGNLFADDSSTFAQTRRVRGYEGRQLITLLDANGRQVFRRQLRKQNFFGVANRDIVTVSIPERPRFLGYHAPTQTLAFALLIAIPYSDVAQQVVIVLGFDGQVRRLVISYLSNWEAPDCEPRLLPDGTVLTCQDLLPPGGKPVHLLKPKSELVAAFPLTDSTLFTAYRYGEYRPVASEGNDQADVSAAFNAPEWVADPRKRNAPNAFIINRQGLVLQQFQYAGHEGVIGYKVPRRYVWQTHTYYLLDEQRGLYLLDKHSPKAVTEVAFQQMQPFRKPQRPAETRFIITTKTAAFAFYIDLKQPTQLRYERLQVDA
ncbi:hypothetical protein MUN82_17135 [Hymenobacter aerilatus]|uniref:DUF4221 domain-containing protein n=1 Tax=Hymenobacter aerilatus TaxID=2932251 RepID=A0A8T9STJ1_9BACT|nr:hypothetical protein [Hymenobacter aerilatus]UOR04661.1 hypothetical protein MUN82_17135 [Hymenobacter aerilatus]